MSPRRGSCPARPGRPWRTLLAVAVAGATFAPCASSAQGAMPVHPAGAASASALAADSGLESQFVGEINSLRSSKGLGALQVSGELVGVARAWTDQMVSAGQISHNPNLGSSVSGGWTKLGENVGVGYDVSGLMQAFINSPSHYQNLVDPAWTHVGVGVTVAADGRIYTTHNFMALGSPAPPPPPPPAPAPAPAAVTPAPAAPTPTTAPPAPAPAPPPPPPAPHPTAARVTAVLDPLRSLEGS